MGNRVHPEKQSGRDRRRCERQHQPWRATQSLSAGTLDVEDHPEIVLLRSSFTASFARPYAQTSRSGAGS